MSVTELDLDAGGDDEETISPEDQAFLDLVERLRPIFGELVKVAVEASIDAVPTPTFRPGQVTNVNASSGIATVLIDGDTQPISAQVICELPGVGDRVYVEFIPPATALVVGINGGSGVPAGTVAFFAGPVTADGLGTEGAGYAPPRGWLRAKGGLYLAEQFPALYAAIGTSHNTGGESTNPVAFRVPNVDDRFIIASGSRTFASKAGSSTISQAMLPGITLSVSSASVSGSVSGSVSISGTTSTDGNHQHGVAFNGFNTAAGGGPNAAGSDFNYASSVAGAHSHTFSGTGFLSGGSFSGTVSGQTASLGGSGAEHLPPYIVLHALIKA